MKPRSITLFALASLAQAVVVLSHGIYAAEIEGMRLQEYFSASTSEALVPFVLTFRLGILVLLTWLVWARASRFAKWTFIVLLLAKMPRLPDALAGLTSANMNSILWMASSILGLFATICLFLPDARYWFARRGGSAEADAAVFE